ncbi:MAG: 2-C-methyl-D-erythritol 2,4-cyclodiphosphate synthase [Candidatus Aminicenantales bacterium]
MKIKLGLGYDIHRLSKGRALYLGGVKIPHHSGLAGHSDGDCVVHALIDALLGALGEGDIGRLYPNTDPKWKDIRSLVLLRKITPLLKRKRAEILNVDLVVVAQAPKLAPHAGRIKKALSPVLGIPEDDIGFKAKTNEGLGLVGRERAIACWAAVLVELKETKRG